MFNGLRRMTSSPSAWETPDPSEGQRVRNVNSRLVAWMGFRYFYAALRLSGGRECLRAAESCREYAGK